MTKYRLEYIWLDRYTPVPNLRGKTQIKDYSAFPDLEFQKQPVYTNTKDDLPIPLRELQMI